MEAVKLPTETAQEPEESARLSQDIKKNPPVDAANPKKGITFAQATQSTENSQASSSTYKDALSQPASGLSHRQRMLWLQKRRTPGLWVQCDSCDRWRFVDHVIDAHELPVKWLCSMNPDKAASDCSVPEAPLRLRDEEDLIHGEYSAGSLVWARLTGYPWWPAMVDDCPDTEQYYWLDGFSDIPTYYNVVFFDAFEATRSWIAPQNLKPFGTNKKGFGLFSKRYKKRIEVALTQAQDAARLPLGKRLGKYSFIARYSGAINMPKPMNKKDLQRFQNKLARKYNIPFSDESEISEDERPQKVERQNSTTVVKKGKNVLLVGSPDPKKRKTRKENVAIQSKKPKRTNSRLQDALLSAPATGQIENETATECNTKPAAATDIFKQPSSMAVQMGSTVTSTVIDASLDNDTSATYVPECEIQIRGSEETLQTRANSPKSDDFDF